MAGVTRTMLGAALAAALAEGALPTLSPWATLRVSAPQQLAQDVLDFEFLDDRLGAVSFHDVPGDLTGTVYTLKHDPLTTDCSASGFQAPESPNKGHWMVLVDTPTDCNGRLGQLALELQELGADAVFFGATECLCGGLDQELASCNNTLCYDTLRPRGSVSVVEALRIPTFVLSRGHTQRLWDYAEQISAGSSAAEKPTLQVSWGVTESSAPQLTLFTSAAETISPFKTAAFVDAVYDRLVKDIKGIEVFPVILDGSAVEFCSRPLANGDCSRSLVVAVDCTAAGLPSAQLEWCALHCTNAGRYCHAETPGVATGAEIVKENLRQACAWTVNRDRSAKAWFQYLALVRDNCLGKSELTQVCSDRMHEEAGLDKTLTSDCVAASEAGAAVNPVLEEFKTTVAALYQQGIVKLPTLVVGNSAVPYGLSWGNLLSGVCAGFVVGSRPSYCSCISTDSTSFKPDLDADILERCFGYAKPGASNTSEEGPSAVAVGLGVVGGLAAAVVVFFAVRTRCWKARRNGSSKDLELASFDEVGLGPVGLGSGAAGGAALDSHDLAIGGDTGASARSESATAPGEKPYVQVPGMEGKRRRHG